MVCALPGAITEPAKTPVQHIAFAATVGSSRTLAEYARKVVLVVNVASKCGLQYGGLQIWADGGEAEFHFWPGGTHAWDAFIPGSPMAEQSAKVSESWIRRLLAARPLTGDQEGLT